MLTGKPGRALIWLCALMPLIFVFNPARSDEGHQTTQAAASEQATKECKQAFDALFGNAHLETANGDKLLDLASSRKTDFLRYDQACFRGISETVNPSTRPFVQAVLGVMGTRIDSKFQPFCTVIRTAADEVSTPAHCWCDAVDYRSSSVRLLSAPKTDFGVVGPSKESLQGKCPVDSDFNDIIRLKLTGGQLPQFQRKSSDFSGVLANTMSIAIFGFDQFRFQYALQSDGESWPDSIVFSPTSGSRKFPPQWLNPQPDLVQQTACLYYAAPTYPGMSGALILGFEQQPDQTGRLFVAGIHLRAGTGDQHGCGRYRGVNIGLSYTFGASHAGSLARN